MVPLTQAGTDNYREDAMDIYQAIRDGKYENKAPYPAHPKKPALFKKSAAELTPEECVMLPTVKAQYEAERANYEVLTKQWYQGEGVATDRFWSDVFADNDMDPEDKFVQKMRSLAWERGHSAGLNDVLLAFEDMLELYELYRDCSKVQTKSQPKGKK